MTEDRARPTPAAALNTTIVVDAAMELVAEGGLEALTMRRLADRLSAHLPMIYRVVKNKDALIGEMAEAILAKAADGLEDSASNASSWEQRIRRHAGGLRLALLAQRDGARIVGGNYAANRATLTYGDKLVGLMHEAGLPRAHSLWAASAVYCLVLGEVLEQQGITGEEIETLENAISGADYPHLTSGPVESLLDFDARFEFGVELLIAGIRRSADQL